MSKLTDLRSLILSLSKSERRYFRLQSSMQEGEKAYLFLFDLLSDENIPSEKEIESGFKTKFPKSDLEQARKHLYQYLLKSLRSYEDDKSIDNRLMNALRNINILFNKGVYSLCFDEISKAKQLALDNEKFLFYILYTKTELEIQSHFSYGNLDEVQLLALNNKSIQLLEQEINTTRHNSLYHTLMNRYVKSGHVRGQEEQDKLNDLLLEEFQLMSSGSSKPFEAEKIHLLFQAAYFLMTSSPKASLKVFKELNKLFLDHQKLWKDSPVHYLYMADGILAEMCLAGAYEQMQTFLEGLKKLETRLDGTTLFIRSIEIKYQLQIAFFTRDDKAALEWLDHFTKELKPKANLIPSNAWIGLLYTASLTFFGIRKYKEALSYINLILNDQSQYVSLQTRSLSRILYLFVHLELDNPELVLYDIRSFERLLKKEKNLFELEIICIRFIKKWLGTTEKKKVAQVFRSDLNNLVEKPVEVRLFRQLPVSQWLQQRYGL
jgi:hypothetical protein